MLDSIVISGLIFSLRDTPIQMIITMIITRAGDR